MVAAAAVTTTSGIPHAVVDEDERVPMGGAGVVAVVGVGVVLKRVSGGGSARPPTNWRIQDA